MRRMSYAVGPLVLLSTLVLGLPAASAIKSHTCSHGELDTKDAKACVKNTENFVLCTDTAGKFCCHYDGDTQVCESITRGANLGGRPTLSGILIEQQQILTNLNNLTGQVQSLISGQTSAQGALASLRTDVAGIKAGIGVIQGDVALCSAPNLEPVPLPGVAGPQGFCRLNADGTKLQVLVANPGSAETDTTGTVTRVVFTTTSGPVQVPSPDVVNTSPLDAGGSQLVEFNIPENWTGDFGIGVDATNLVAETNEADNTVAGRCGGAVIFAGTFCCSGSCKTEGTTKTCSNCATGGCGGTNGLTEVNCSGNTELTNSPSGGTLKCTAAQ